MSTPSSRVFNSGSKSSSDSKEKSELSYNETYRSVLLDQNGQYNENGINLLTKLTNKDIARLQDLAKKNCSDAMVDLAYCYGYPCVVEEDLKQSYELMWTAYLLKNTLATWILADYYVSPRYEKVINLKKKNRNAKAFEFYSRAAEDGLAIAQYDLAQLYSFNSLILPANEREKSNCLQREFHWTKKAADLGLADAQFTLAELYRDKLWLPEEDQECNFKLATEYCQKAAEQGHEDAQLELASFKILSNESTVELNASLALRKRATNTLKHAAIMEFDNSGFVKYKPMLFEDATSLQPAKSALNKAKKPKKKIKEVQAVNNSGVEPMQVDSKLEQEKPMIGNDVKVESEAEKQNALHQKKQPAIAEDAKAKEETKVNAEKEKEALAELERQQEEAQAKEALKLKQQEARNKPEYAQNMLVQLFASNAQVKDLRMQQMNAQQEFEKIQLQIESFLKIIKDRQIQIEEQEKSINVLKHKKLDLEQNDNNKTPMEIDSKDKAEEMDINDILEHDASLEIQASFEKLTNMQNELMELHNKLLIAAQNISSLQLQEAALLKTMIGQYNAALLSRKKKSLKLESNIYMLNAMQEAETPSFLPGYRMEISTKESEANKRKDGPEDLEQEKSKMGHSSKQARTQ